MCSLLVVMFTKVIFVNVTEDVLLFFTFMILFGTVYSSVGPFVSTNLDIRSIVYKEEVNSLLDQKIMKLQHLQSLHLMYASLQSEFFSYLVEQCNLILSLQVHQNEETLLLFNGLLESNLESELLFDSQIHKWSADEFFDEFLPNDGPSIDDWLWFDNGEFSDDDESSDDESSDDESSFRNSN